jgi:hypothetical protein
LGGFHYSLLHLKVHALLAQVYHEACAAGPARQAAVGDADTAAQLAALGAFYGCVRTMHLEFSEPLSQKRLAFSIQALSKWCRYPRGDKYSPAT